MPRTKISEFSSTPASNTDIDSINIAENCPPSGINDAIRELMAQLKDWQSGTSNDPYVVGSSGSLTLNQGTANGVAYLNGSKVVTSGSALTFDGTNLGVGGSPVSSYRAAINGDYWQGNGSGAIIGTIKNSSGWYEVASSSNVLGVQLTSAATTPIRFLPEGTEQMRLTSTGLGIGTSSPAVKLDVAGALRSIISGGTPIIYFNNGSTQHSISNSSGAMPFDIAGVERMRLDTSGNLGLGVTPSAWFSSAKVLQIGATASLSDLSGAYTLLGQNYKTGTAGQDVYLTTGAASLYSQNAGGHRWYSAPSGTAGANITLTQAATLTANGDFLVGSTSGTDGRIKVDATSGSPVDCAVWAKNSAGSASGTYVCWNAATTGNNGFMDFYTETSANLRGSISYNRTAGLTAYNTTSDYRAKDISGPVTGSGALIDSTPVYMGKMKGATQERPMFIAHETPAYAHTGVKDAVDADGNPVYQQMDASALIPVMWAEIQSLRKRLADAGI